MESRSGDFIHGACLVSHSSNGQDNCGLVWIELDLRPKSLDMHIDQPGVSSVSITPHLLQEHFSSHHLAWVLREGDEQINYKPSVDITFGSATRAFGGDALGVILTGMGADGREGARMLKKLGATIWAQDAASCVVYGMPQAVAAEGIATHSIPLNQMAEAILRETHRH